MHSNTPSSIQHPSVGLGSATAFAMAVAVAGVVLDLGTRLELDVAVVYGIPLVVAAFSRSRRLLWALMAVLTLATFVTYALQVPPGAFELREALFVNRILDAVALLVTACLVHAWMTSLDMREVQARQLADRTGTWNSPTICSLHTKRRSSVRTRISLAAGRRRRRRAPGRRASLTPSRMTYAIR